MSAVVEFVKDVVGGVVEAVGDVVEDVVDVVKDVGRAIDDYVIQPILDDPLTAIATAAAATFLGPAAASLFGTSASVGVGIAAGAANTAVGLVQGEDFDEAIKGGLMAGVGAGVGAEFFGPSATPGTDSLDDFLAANNNFVDVPMDGLTSGASSLATPPVATPSPTDSLDDFLAANNNFADVPVDMSAAPAAASASGSPTPLESINPTADAASASASATPSPLQSLNTAVPQVDIPTFSSGLDTSFSPDYNLSSGMKPQTGLQAPKFTAADSLDIYGNPNYSLVPPGTSGGPGLQLPDSPNIPRMGGGQGITGEFQGLPQYMEDGVPTTFKGESGKIYGNATPDVTVSASGVTPVPQTITYDATTNMGTPNLWDQVTSGNLTDAAKNIGGQAIDWVKQNPWTAIGAGLTVAGAGAGAGGAGQGSTPVPGATQDKNFTKSLDLYEYMRDKANYGGDLTKYGQVGQPTSGEHQFFRNTRFVPIPIPGQEPKAAKMGGLIQMKHYAQGGQVDGMQDPRRAQMMAAMAQQQPAGQGGPMGMAQGRPPMQQGLPAQGRPQMLQGGPQGGLQGMQQGRPQMPQRPRDPKMAYYQYGNPPVQQKAMGGLSQVQSMRIGGGADGRSDDVNAVLSDGEYVFDAEAVAMLGNGSSKAGAKKLDDMRAKLRQHKGKALAGGKISPDAKSPLAYLKGA